MVGPSRIVVALILLLMLVVAADLAAGQVITSRIRTVASRRLAGPIRMSLGGAPARPMP